MGTMSVTKEQVQRIFVTADAVCFDVDSTVCRDEAIDELAKFCGKGDQVASITRSAMGGKLSFRDSLKKRLQLINPTTEQLTQFIRLNPPKLTDNIRDLVSLLQSRGVAVFLVSGGFQKIIAAVATQLNVPQRNIYANTILFSLDGRYTGVDEDEPTSDDGGKGRVVESLKRQFSFRRLVMIGDGATDLEASPPADAFIGFGGNVCRDEIRSRAKYYVTAFSELIDLLNKHPCEARCV